MAGCWKFGERNVFSTQAHVGQTSLGVKTKKIRKLTYHVTIYTRAMLDTHFLNLRIVHTRVNLALQRSESVQAAVRGEKFSTAKVIRKERPHSRSARHICDQAVPNRVCNGVSVRGRGRNVGHVEGLLSKAKCDRSTLREGLCSAKQFCLFQTVAGHTSCKGKSTIGW